MNNVVTMFILIIIVAILGVGIGLSLESLRKDNNIIENEKLRVKLEGEIRNVASMRAALAEERKYFEERIKESEVRYNELERLHTKNEAALKSEINRLKESTVKELEDEAERIYSAGCKQ